MKLTIPLFPGFLDTGARSNRETSSTIERRNGIRTSPGTVQHGISGVPNKPREAAAGKICNSDSPDSANVSQATARALPRLDEDSRILPILDHLSQGFIAGVPSEYASAEESGDAVTAEMIDEMSRKHFPMCMRNLHDTLRKERHLKHYGRLQYGLFLKVSGEYF